MDTHKRLVIASARSHVYGVVFDPLAEEYIDICAECKGERAHHSHTGYGKAGDPFISFRRVRLNIGLFALAV